MSNVTNIEKMFTGMEGIQYIYARNWNLRYITDLNNMFSNLSTLKKIDLKGWNTENVTSLYYMFYNDGNLTSADLSGWNTSKVTSMAFTFYGTTNLGNLIGLDGWNTASLTNLCSTFEDNRALTNVDFLSGWNVEKVNSIDGIFYDMRNLTNIDGISGWKLGKWYITNGSSHYVTIGAAFKNCTSLKSFKAIKDWEPSITSRFLMYSSYHTGSSNFYEGAFEGLSSITQEGINYLNNWKIAAHSDVPCLAPNGPTGTKVSKQFIYMFKNTPYKPSDLKVYRLSNLNTRVSFDYDADGSIINLPGICN
jgi:surface protein